MPQDTIVGNVLDGVDHRLTERFRSSSIACILWRMCAVGQGCLDGLDQDIGTVISCSTVCSKVGSTVDRVVLLDESLRRRYFGLICSCNGRIHRPTVIQSNGAGKGARLQAITTSERSIFQSSNLQHLLADQYTSGRVKATKVDHIGMLRRDLGEQRHVGGSCTWLAAASKHLSTKGLPFLAEGISDTEAIGLRIVDHIDALVPLCLIEVVRTCWTLVAVGGGNTEVSHLSCGT